MRKILEEYGGFYVAGYLVQFLALGGVLGSAAMGVW